MKRIKPLMPYCGGKRKVAPMLANIIRPYLQDGVTYYEPFVGGGAVYLELNHPNSVIGDVVPDLINLYRCIRDDYKKVLWYYGKLPNNYLSYYMIRDFDRNPHFKTRDNYFKAARFLYLCKTGFGSCRFNQYGLANQSYFQHPERSIEIDEGNMLLASRLLKKTEINLGDFSETLSTAKAGDIAYLDPPYIDTNFDRYWIKKFKQDELMQLKTQCDELDSKGVYFILSHSSNESVRELYQNYHFMSLQAFCDYHWQSNTNSRYRDEYLITNIDDFKEYMETA